MEEQKTYKELTFVDDFMFCKIMTTHLDICKEVLELILDIPIKEVSLPEAQKSIDMTAEAKSVRLDVYANDKDNTIYDIEMQTTYNKNLPKRSRYYQGMIDLNLIEKGEDYEKLKKSYVIFICMEKPFKDTPDLPVYTFENLCKEDKTISLKDDAMKVFLNVACKSNNIPLGIKNFFDFLKGNVPEGELSKKIAKSVDDAIEHLRWEDEYMTLLRRDKEKYEEGERSAILRLVSKGKLSLTDAAQEMATTINNVMNLLQSGGYDTTHVKQ